MSDLFSKLALNLYGYTGYAVQPFLPSLLHFRMRKGKEDPARLRERYGFPSISSDGRVTIWVHAASIGETRAVLPLIRRLVGMQFQVVLTTVTLTASQVAAVELPKGAVHQFAPLDIKNYVARFLKNWQPSLAIFVESELWPNTMTQLRRRSIPQILVNARMSERSFKRWSKFGTVTRALFENINLCVAQTEEDGRRFEELGVEAVIEGGNLKFDSDLPDVNEADLAKLQSAIGHRPVWLAASTHEKEELIVAKAHVALRKKFNDLLTVIVPRHPERAAELVQLFRKNGLKVAMRSEGVMPADETDIYMADTVGELGLFYRLAPCSLVGGSLVPHGGQNPIEPARLGSAIIHGPNIANFSHIFRALEEHGGAICVKNSDELINHVSTLLSDAQRSGEMTSGAKKALSKFSGALEGTHRALLPYLNPLIVTGRLADVSARRVAGE